MFIGDVAPSGGDGSATLSDSQIVAVVHGADSGEIDQAHEAIRKYSLAQAD